eukprot:7879797-Alexandrium_andersonii.AAC.1
MTRGAQYPPSPAGWKRGAGCLDPRIAARCVGGEAGGLRIYFGRTAGEATAWPAPLSNWINSVL